jgi:hypothetical protein
MGVHFFAVPQAIAVGVGIQGIGFVAHYFHIVVQPVAIAIGIFGSDL